MFSEIIIVSSQTVRVLMKGITFLKSIEYTLEAIGEKWRQGDRIKGTLKIKNNGSENVEHFKMRVALLEGHYKKLKTNVQNGWTFLSEVNLAESACLETAAERSYSFVFELPQDCPITDKSGSLYLAFYEGLGTLPLGHVELVIEPKLVISQVLEIFENFLRFKVVQIKYVKGKVEVKLNPPSSREFSTIDSLVLSLREHDKNLSLNYLFNTQVINMVSGAMQAQKKTRDLEQKFNAKQYLSYEGSLNQDFILESVNKAINEVKPKFL